MIRRSSHSKAGFITPPAKNLPAGGGGLRFDIAPDGDRFIVLGRGATGQTGDDAPFNGLIFVENWFQEPTERVPIPQLALHLTNGWLSISGQ